MKQTLAEKDLHALTESLIHRTQIPHQYFEYKSLLLLNISTNEDSLQEYAIFKKDIQTEKYYKFECLTVSWMSEDDFMTFVERWEKEDITNMNAIVSDVPLRESRRTHIDHVFTFNQFDNYKKLFKDWACQY